METNQPYWDDSKSLSKRKFVFRRHKNFLAITMQKDENSIKLIDTEERKVILSIGFFKSTKILKIIKLHDNIIVILSQDTNNRFIHFFNEDYLFIHPIYTIYINKKFEIIVASLGERIVSNKLEEYDQIVDIISYEKDFYIVTKRFFLRFDWIINRKTLIAPIFKFKHPNLYHYWYSLEDVKFIHSKLVGSIFIIQIKYEYNKSFKFFVDLKKRKVDIKWGIEKELYFSEYEKKYFKIYKNDLYVVDALIKSKEEKKIDIKKFKIINLRNYTFEKLINEKNINIVDIYYFGKKEFKLDSFDMKDEDEKSILVFRTAWSNFFYLAIWNMKENEITLVEIPYNIISYKLKDLIFQLIKDDHIKILKNNKLIFETKSKKVKTKFLDYINTNKLYDTYHERFELIKDTPFVFDYYPSVENYDKTLSEIVKKRGTNFKGNLRKIYMGLKEPNKEEFFDLYNLFSKTNMNMHLITLIESIKSYLFFEDLIYLFEESNKIEEKKDIFYISLFMNMKKWIPYFVDQKPMEYFQESFKFCKNLRKNLIEKYEKYTTIESENKLEEFYKANKRDPSTYLFFSDLYSHILEYLYKQKKKSNLILVPDPKFEKVDKDFKFNAHKEILILESNFFYVMFRGSWKETTQKEIIIKGFNKENLISLMQLIYVNTLPVDFVNLENLLKLFEHSEMYLEDIRKIKLRWWFIYKTLRKEEETKKEKTKEEETSVLFDIFRTIVNRKGSIELANYGNDLLKLKGGNFTNYIIKKYKKLCN